MFVYTSCSIQLVCTHCYESTPHGVNPLFWFALQLLYVIALPIHSAMTYKKREHSWMDHWHCCESIVKAIADLRDKTTQCVQEKRAKMTALYYKKLLYSQCFTLSYCIDMELNVEHLSTSFPDQQSTSSGEMGSKHFKHHSIGLFYLREIGFSINKGIPIY